MDVRGIEGERYGLVLRGGRSARLYRRRIVYMYVSAFFGCFLQITEITQVLARSLLFTRREPYTREKEDDPQEKDENILLTIY